MRALRIVPCAICGDFRALANNQITEIPADVFSGLVNLQALYVRFVQTWFPPMICSLSLLLPPLSSLVLSRYNNMYGPA